MNGCFTRRPVSKPSFSPASMVTSDVPRLRHSATKSAAAGFSAATCGGDRVFGRDGQEGHAEQGVGAGGVDLDRLRAAVQAEDHPRAFRSADPVGLHEADAFGPAVEGGQRVQQFRRIFGDAEEPLAELLLFHRRAGAPAFAVDHLLIGQHGAVDRVPVDPAFLALDQAGLEEIEEQLLLVAVVFRLAGGELALPFQRQAHALEFGAHRRRCSRRSIWRGGRHARGRRSRRAGRRRPSPWGASRRSRGRACSGRRRRRGCSCGHAPCGSCRWGRGTSPARSISACRRSARPPPGSRRVRPRPACQRGSAAAKS